MIRRLVESYWIYPEASLRRSEWKIIKWHETDIEASMAKLHMLIKEKKDFDAACNLWASLKSTEAFNHFIFWKICKFVSLLIDFTRKK